MKKSRRMLPYIALGILSVFFCWLFVWQYGVFGSRVDWISQHSVFPDYFRQQFYKTGELFPEFAANIGGGQNIYNFSYYGLYNPVILFSYLLPFIKMSDYIMAASMISLAVSVMLIYKWLKNRGCSGDICFLTAVFFLLSGPMIFQSYSQIMFVNYMPFLCLSLFGVDNYFEKNKIGLYTVGVFLMILTSFYFSIGGMFVLVLYGIYRYSGIKEETGMKVKVSGFLLDGIKFVMPMLAAVLMSGILLVPTAAALAGRNGEKSVIDFTSLFIPDIPVSRFVYKPYGIGLTTIVVTVLITGLTYKKWSEKLIHLMCIVSLTFPLFPYLLNGGLYIRDKVLIPFLPLLCYLVAYYLEKQKKREISFIAGFLPFLLTLFLVYMEYNEIRCIERWKKIMLDAVIMIICFLIFYWKRYVQILILAPVFLLILSSCEISEHTDKIAQRGFYCQITDKNIGNAVKEIVHNENGDYRIEQFGTDEENAANMNRIWDMEQYVSSVYSSSYNAEYQKFRKETFGLTQTYRNYLMQPTIENPIFQKFMGVKYLLSDKKLQGYELYKTVGNIHIYKNENVSPIAYATDKVISEDEYLQLKYPYNELALGNTAVVNTEKTQCVWKTPVSEIKLPKKEYQVKRAETVKIEIPEAEENAILFLKFGVKNHRPSKDVEVWLEGVRNKLTSKKHIYYNENNTFHYTIALEKGQKEVELKLGKGNYEITDLQCYIGNSQNVGQQLYQSEFRLDKEETKGNKIVGNIEVLNDGYFITTIPYDSAFEVQIDGKKVPYEKVNTAFLGTKIEKGNHEIELIYHAPGMKLGKIMSVVGAIMFVVLAGGRRKNSGIEKFTLTLDNRIN